VHIEEESVDDLLNRVYSSLLNGSNDQRLVNTSKGNTAERIGALLRLRNPRARLSASEMRLKLISALGEFIWYVAGSDDPAFIQHYIDWYKNVRLDSGRVPGAYGPRLFGAPPYDQISKVVNILKQRPNSRRAVVQLYRADDLALSLGATSTSDLFEVPCTCTLQFLNRGGTLLLVVYMRSNDAYKGLPHDVFCFTMLQEVVARAVGVELGCYVHCVGSLHLYEDDWALAKAYLEEGWHSVTPMPDMPPGDQMSAIGRVVAAERAIRTGQGSVMTDALAPYWRDMVLLLQAHSALGGAPHESRSRILQETRNQVSCEGYKRYLLDRENALERERADMEPRK
jgi:thymidylate synthase